MPNANANVMSELEIPDIPPSVVWLSILKANQSDWRSSLGMRTTLWMIRALARAFLRKVVEDVPERLRTSKIECILSVYLEPYNDGIPNIFLIERVTF